MLRDKILKAWPSKIDQALLQLVCLGLLVFTPASLHLPENFGKSFKLDNGNKAFFAPYSLNSVLVYVNFDELHFIRNPRREFVGKMKRF